jgi:hypothetical protein
LSRKNLEKFLKALKNYCGPSPDISGLFQKSKTVLDNSPKTDRILKFPQGEIFEIIGHRSHRFYWKPSRGSSPTKRGSSPMPFAELERLEVAGRSAH